ncbi:MAG: citryl-CoA lyase [Chloroflexi bacterium]|nr:citryl-CoA lyase [Chloroflexota bacterium]
MAEKWKTSITYIEPNKILLRGYRVDELMGKITFPEAVYLALRGELPSEGEGKVIDAILVSSVDHGITAPSTLVARTLATTGVPLTTALAGGVSAVNRFHGGAIEGCMRYLYDAAKEMDGGKSATEAAADLLERLKKDGVRMPGFGHRVHTCDPRSVKLFQIAEEAGVKGKFTDLAGAVEAQLEIGLGKKLPINVDGAIAVVLCEMGFPPETGNAFFAMSRIVGMTAHYFEEISRYKPMRRIDQENWEYDGPQERKPGGR